MPDDKVPVPIDTSQFKVNLADALRVAIYSLLAGEKVVEASEDVILGKTQSTGEAVVPIAREKSGVVAGVMGAILASIEPWTRSLADVLIQLTAPIATTVLKTLGDARNDSAQPLNTVITQALSDLLGVDFAPGDVPVGGSLGANTERARAIGDKLHSVLLAEFAPDGVVTPESGERAARAFSGFNVNFGVTSAFISIVAEMFSLGQFKEFRELGVEVAENLGLGRMHRMAIKPMFDNTVSKPYDRLLRKRYRQDHLSEGQFVKALHRGTIPEEDVREALAQKGLPDDYITEVLSQGQLHLTDSELERLVRHGALQLDQALAHMRADGWSDDNARLKLAAIELSYIDSATQSILSEYRALVKHRFMDTETFHTLVNELPLSETQKTWEIRLAGATLDFAHERITHAELTGMLEHGIVDLNYADEWAKGKGYSDTDSLNLELLYFSKEKDKADAAKAKAERLAAAAAAKAAKAAGKPTAPSTTGG